MKKLLLILPLIALLIAGTGCNKEQERTYLFWWDQSTSNRLRNDNITTLYFYVDFEYIGSESTSTYWTSEPECGSTGAIEKSFTYTKKTDYIGRVIGYEVKDQNGNILAYSSISNNKDCFITKLVY